MLKAGDIVVDRVTGGDFMLSYYDPDADAASWVGAPEGAIVGASERLLLAVSATEESSLRMMARYAIDVLPGADGEVDHRVIICRRLASATVLCSLLVAFLGEP